MHRVVGTFTALLALSACLPPKQIHERPVLDNNGEVRSVDEEILSARVAAHEQRESASWRRDSIAAIALARCDRDVCDAIARGELALGMSPAQVMAVTRTTPEAWAVRRAGDATVMVPRSTDDLPRDVLGNVAVVQLADGGVTSYSYRESQGLRVVSSAGDATNAGRARALASALIREGDDFAAAGDFTRALDRFDRASVLVPNDAEVDYRIATSLDKLLRPQEAAIRYRLFLHKLELERIDAVGDANAKLADAIARAQQRIIVLERQGR
ncbi:MAG TPA: hypothetical protein VKA84_23950 [Gemmatimonadaceae bacterium]|nr:hypothetical protein [Gemmatimonadaceae bacterium]